MKSTNNKTQDVNLTESDESITIWGGSGVVTITGSKQVLLLNISATIQILICFIIFLLIYRFM